MSLHKKPFINYTLGEKNPLDQGKILTVRMNKEEYAQLMIMCKAMNISRDSTALKKLAFIGQNVIHNTFGLDFFKWMMDAERIVDDSKLDKLTIEKKENVTQKPIDL